MWGRNVFIHGYRSREPKNAIEFSLSLFAHLLPASCSIVSRRWLQTSCGSGRVMDFNFPWKGEKSARRLKSTTLSEAINFAPFSELPTMMINVHLRHHSAIYHSSIFERLCIEIIRFASLNGNYFWVFISWYTLLNWFSNELSGERVRLGCCDEPGLECNNKKGLRLRAEWVEQ